MPALRRTFFQFLAIIALFWGYSSFAQTASDNAQFLESLGFEHYTDQMQATLSNPQLKLDSWPQEILQKNQDRFQIFDISRDLALKLFEANETRLNDPVLRTKMVAFTLQLFKRHFLLTMEPLPPEVTKLRGKSEFEDARKKFLTDLANSRYHLETQILTKYLLGLLPEGPDTPKMVSNLQKYLKYKYEDLSFQNTAYFGRALLALLVRHSRMKQVPALEKELEQAFLSQDDHIGNYITPVQWLRNKNNQWESVTLHSGDFANEYSRGTEAFYISFGVQPSEKSEKQFAHQSHLLGKKDQIPLYGTPDGEDALVKKWKAGRRLNPLEKMRLKMIQHNAWINGFSHVGLVEIKTDASSGISMPWIWDIYPSDGPGGIRFIGPEGFAFQERFQKVGYTQYDPVKFKAYFDWTMKNRGYAPEVWSTFELDFTPGDEATANKDKPTNLPTEISKQEAEKLAEPVQNPNEWYQRQIIPRVLNMMHRYLVSEDVLGFSTNFINAKGMAYCSQAVVLAFLQGVDVDPQAKLDQYDPLLRWAKNHHFSVNDYFDINARIISPSGFAWQTALVKNFTAITFPTSRRPKSAYDDNFDQLLNSVDSEIINRTRVSAMEFKDLSLDPVLEDDDL